MLRRIFQSIEAPAVLKVVACWRWCRFKKGSFVRRLVYAFDSLTNRPEEARERKMDTLRAHTQLAIGTWEKLCAVYSKAFTKGESWKPHCAPTFLQISFSLAAEKITFYNGSPFAKSHYNGTLPHSPIAPPSPAASFSFPRHYYGAVDVVHWMVRAARWRDYPGHVYWRRLAV